MADGSPFSGTSDTGALFAALSAVPRSPRPLARVPRYYWSAFKSTTDYVAHNLPRLNRVLTRVNPYPRPFRPTRFEGEGGAELHGWIAKGAPGASGLVIVPGTFQTKDDTVRKARAIRLAREHGLSVLIYDQRGFGASFECPGAGGYLEARDVHHAARHLARETGAERVGAFGESLGGSAVLLAAADDDAPRVLPGGALAMSPFADLRRQLRYACSNPGRGHPFFVPYHFYRFLVWVRSRGEYTRFDHYLRLRADALAVPLDHLLDHGSPERFVHRIRIPTVILHAKDDPIVPVDHALALQAAAQGNPWVRVLVADEGGHCYLDHADPAWFWGVLDRFLHRAEGQGF